MLTIIVISFVLSLFLFLFLHQKKDEEIGKEMFQGMLWGNIEEEDEGLRDLQEMQEALKHGG